MELDPDARRQGVVDLLATGMARAIRRRSCAGADDGARISVVDSTASAAMGAPVSLSRGLTTDFTCHPSFRRISLNLTDVGPSVTSSASMPVNEDLSWDAVGAMDVGGSGQG